jgi:FixJ family two-component response regulator
VGTPPVFDSKPVHLLPPTHGGRDALVKQDGTVLVVDDDASVRRSTERLVRARGIDVRSFASAREFLDAMPIERPACLVLDVRMPGGSGLDLQHELAQRDAEIPIIFLTGHGDIPMSVRAMRAGASDFLTKPVKREQIVAAVAAALERHALASADRAQRDEVKRRYDSLTVREREVFHGVVAGMLNKQIAAQLDIAERTVKAHRSQVMEKMNAASIADLVRQGEHLEE